MEPFQPVVKVNVRPLQLALRDTSSEHFVTKVAETHVAGSAVVVCHHHDLFHAQLVDGNDEAPHGGVPGRGNYCSGVLDNLSVPVLKAQCIGQKEGQSRIHTAEDGEFLVRVLVRSVLLVVAFGYIAPVEGKNIVDATHISVD